MNENPYMMLAKVILPKEMTEYFDLTKVRTDEYNGEPRIHLYLDEKDKAPDNRTDLSPNGFYEESCMNDFPIREYRTVLHVRRRRWKDADGKSVSKDWQMVATGWNKVRERHHEHDHTLVNVAVGGYNGHVLAPEQRYGK